MKKYSLLCTFTALLLNISLNASPIDRDFAYGEWPFVGQDELNSGSHSEEKKINVNNANTLVKIWNFSNQGREVAVLSQPVVSNGAAFVADTGGHVYSLDTAKGNLLWKTKLPLQVFKSAPTLDSNNVYVGSNTIYCLDKKKGGIKWSTKLYEPGHPTLVSTSTAIIINKMLICGIAPGPSGQSSIVALDTSTGKILWKLPLVDETIGQRNWSTPAVDTSRNLLFIGSYNPVNTKVDALLAIDYTKGTLVWSTKLSSQVVILRPTLLSHPVGGHPNLFTINNNGKNVDYVGIGCRDGHYRIFKRDQVDLLNVSPLIDITLDPGSSYGPIATINNGILYVVSSAAVDAAFNRIALDKIYCIDPRQYAQNIMNNANMKVCAIDLAKLIRDGNANGTIPKSALLWTNTCKGVGLNNRLTFANGVLYESSWTGFFRCLNAVNGTELVKKVVSPAVKNSDYPFPAFIGGGATICDGQVYVSYGMIDIGQDIMVGGVAAYKIYNSDDQINPLDYIDVSVDL